MQPREAFKLGFLARCVEEGMSPEQTHALAKTAAVCLQKQADDTLTGKAVKTFTQPIQEISNTAWSMLPWLGAAAAAPPVLGGVAAYLQNAAMDRGDDVVEEAKQEELTDTYSRMADQLRRAKQLRDYKQTRKRTGQVYL